MSENVAFEFELNYQSVEALSALTKFAEKENGYIPLLSNINFTVRDGELLAYATDRYHLGELSLTRLNSSLKFPGVDYRFNIPATVFSKLKTQFKMSKKGVVSVRIDSGRYSFDYAGMNVSGALFEGEYPAVWGLLVDEPSGRVGIQAVNFDKFLGFAPMWKALKDNEGWVVTQPEPGKPIQITAPAFRGVVMPVRFGDGVEAGSWVKRGSVETSGVSDSALADTLERVTVQKEMLVVEVERLRAELDAVKAKPLDTKPVEEVATEVKPVEVKPVKKPRRKSYKAGLKKVKAMPYVTPKMVARIEKKLSENVPVVEAVAWALGTNTGKRFDRVMEALA